MKYLILLLTSLLSSQLSWGQYKFLANNCAEQYKAKIFVSNCDGQICDGKSTIILYDKVTEKEIQTFNSPNLSFSLNANQNAKLGWIELGKYQSPLVFGDFNFDGNEDLAIRNGSNGAYSSPSFDVYLASGAKFVLSDIYTKLASEHLGMFSVDRKNKYISIEQKDGCCYYKTIDYGLDRRRNLVEVSSVIEDARFGDDVTVITQKIVNGRVKKTVEKFKTKTYYSAQ